jgi:hypothetical protein
MSAQNSSKNFAKIFRKILGRKSGVAGLKEASP